LEWTAIWTLQFGERLVTGPSRLVNGFSTGVGNIGNPEYAVPLKTFPLTLQIAASGFVPGGAMTPGDVATIMTPAEIGQARRGLRNTGFWAVDTGGAALDTYVVVAPVSYGVSGALSRGSTTNLSPEARFYLQELEQNAGQVVVPPGRISARIISEISAETGAEVGLVRLHSGERVMTIGYIQEGKLFIPLRNEN
jgi:hypothetical protein